jgi:hypothetical protein
MQDSTVKRTVKSNSSYYDDQSKRWIAVAADLHNHAIVGAGQSVKPADPSRGSYSVMEAWLFLLCNASWREKAVANRGRDTTVGRGELVAARGYLATLWNWSPHQVRALLDRLVVHQMIETVRQQFRQQDDRQIRQHSNNQANVVRICNYSRYQHLPKAEKPAVSPALPPAEAPAKSPYIDIITTSTKTEDTNRGDNTRASARPPLQGEVLFRGRILDLRESDRPYLEARFPHSSFDPVALKAIEARMMDAGVRPTTSGAKTWAAFETQMEVWDAQQAALQDKSVKAARDAGKAEMAVQDEHCKFSETGQIILMNGMELEILEMVGGDRIRLRRELARAGKYINKRERGLVLFDSIRNQVAKQLDWKDQGPPRGGGGRRRGSVKAIQDMQL